MKRLRIAMVLPNLDVGGMETLAIALARALRERGHDVQFLLTQAAGAQADLVRAEGMDVTVIPLMGKRPIIGSPELRSWLMAERIDVLHTHSGDWFKVAPCARAIRDLAVVHTQHGEAERDLASRVLRWRAARHTDFFVAVSEGVAEQLRAEARVPRRRIAVVPNGVDAAVFQSADAASRHEARARMGIRCDETLVVGVIARMDAAKNHAMVLRAFARLRAVHADAVLVLVGDGPLDQEVRETAQSLMDADTVRFLGARADVPTLLHGFDVVVLGSRTEGTSMTLLEAMATGIPCVATDVGGTRALFRDGEFGVLVPDDDERAMTAALDALARDPQRRRTLGSAARRHVETEYSMSALTRKYEAVYDACVPAVAR